MSAACSDADEVALGVEVEGEEINKNMQVNPLDGTGAGHRSLSSLGLRAQQRDVDGDGWQREMMTVEELPVRGAYVYRGVLSPAECENIVTTMDETAEWQAANPDKSTRDCERTSYFSNELSELVLSRLDINHSLPEEIRSMTVTRQTTVASGAMDELGTEGSWRAHSLNDYWRVCRYSDGGFFLPHHDGLLVLHPGEPEEKRSFLTVMLYLTSGFEGGETVFLPEELKLYQEWASEDVIAKASPEPGMCLVFVHSTLHAGAPVSRPDESMPMKYILRTELLYKREGDVPGPEDGGWAPEAIQLLREARALEASGDFPAAIKAYNRLRYRHPELAEAARL